MKRSGPNDLVLGNVILCKHILRRNHANNKFLKQEQVWESMYQQTAINYGVLVTSAVQFYTFRLNCPERVKFTLSPCESPK